jgi:hypothetical protein
MNPLAPFREDEQCWCGSQRGYVACHGRPVASAPGAPFPPDEPGRTWIAPITSLTRTALESMAQQALGARVSCHLISPSSHLHSSPTYQQSTWLRCRVGGRALSFENLRRCGLRCSTT